MFAVNLRCLFFHQWLHIFIIATIQVHGEWLVYSNQLVLFPAVVPTSTGIQIARGPTTVIPVECHYKR